MKANIQKPVVNITVWFLLGIVGFIVMTFFAIFEPAVDLLFPNLYSFFKEFGFVILVVIAVVWIFYSIVKKK